MGNSSKTRMMLPKDHKMSLSLVQRYLVLQCHVPIGSEFNIGKEMILWWAEMNTDGKCVRYADRAIIA